jgi:large subunit ribosomal protein L24
VPWAEGTFAIANGQVRLGAMLAPAQGADVNLSGRYELGAGAVTVRLALAGPPMPPTPERPEIVATYRGPLGAPQRSVDVSTLVTWLALRSVEQQAKQLEALESKRREALAARAVPETAPAAPTPPAAPAPTAAPSNGVESPVPAPQQEVPPAAAEGAAAPTVQQAPALPPPVVVRPTSRPPRQVEVVPGTPQALPRPRPPQRPAGTPPSAAVVPNVAPAPPQQPNPADNRSFFERLFSPQTLQQN